MVLLSGNEAQADQPQHRVEAKMEYLSRQSYGNGLTVAKLSNGMTVMVRENHAAPLATARCYVTNTGSAFEGEYLGAGISHLVEHLVSGGTTKKRSEDEVQALVDSLGGKTNAYTSNDITAYFIDAPASRIKLAIELVADSMQHCTIPKEEYLRELGVVQRELEMGLNDKSRVSYQAMKGLVFTEHPMRHPIVGYLPVLQNTTHEDVLNFYHSRYVPQNMIFVVAGDVDTNEMLDEVLAQFESFQRTHEQVPNLPIEPDQASPRSNTIEFAAETVQISFAWPTIPLQHPDLYPLDVASYVLASGDTSRLQKRLKIDEPLAISVSSSSYTPGFVKGWFSVSVECKPENVEKCRKIMLEEIARLKTELPSEEELDKVKRQKAAEHVFSQQTVQAQAESIARSYRSSGDPLFDEQYVKGIQTVTPEQIREVAQLYFKPERQNNLRIVPIGMSKDTEYSSSDKTESAIVKKVLPNGLTVLLKRHPVVPLVSMQAYVKAGVLSDTEKTSGRAALAASLMDRGTEKYTAEQISQYFDSVGGSLSVDSQRNSTYVSSSVLSGDFTEAFDYFYQVTAAPLFLEEEFGKSQKRQLGAIAARKSNPQAEIMDLWVNQLPSSEAYSRTVLGTEETVGKLTVNDCRSFHAELFVPENMVLSIFGDIDPDKTMEMIEASFGTLPKRSFNDPKFPASHAQSPKVDKTFSNQRKDTALIMVGYPTVSVEDIKSRTTLSVIQNYLTGGLGGKLYGELRGARLVYYVYGFEMTGLAPGYFVFLAQTTPKDVGEVQERIEANLKELQEGGIPEEALKSIKEKMIAKHALENTTATAQAFQVSLDELYGLGYDFDKGYEERVNSVTSEDVKQVITKYFQDPIVVRTVSEEK